jgi:hypothetical protein
MVAERFNAIPLSLRATGSAAGAFDDLNPLLGLHGAFTFAITPFKDDAQRAKMAHAKMEAHNPKIWRGLTS